MGAGGRMVGSVFSDVTSRGEYYNNSGGSSRPPEEKKKMTPLRFIGMSIGMDSVYITW